MSCHIVRLFFREIAVKLSFWLNCTVVDGLRTYSEVQIRPDCSQRMVLTVFGRSYSDSWLVCFSPFFFCFISFSFVRVFSNRRLAADTDTYPKNLKTLSYPRYISVSRFFSSPTIKACLVHKYTSLCLHTVVPRKHKPVVFNIRLKK